MAYYSLRNSYKLYIGSASGWSGSPTMWERPNLYVEIRAGDLGVRRTKVITGNKMPVWNEEFIIFGEISSTISISIKRDIGDLDKDPCVGRVDIPIDTLLAQCEDDQSILGLKSNVTGGHVWSMARITVRLGRVTNIANCIQGELVHDLFEHGQSQMSQFKDFGKQRNLEQGVSTLRLVVELTHEGHSDMPRFLYTLAISLMDRYQLLHELSNLEGCISNLTQAIGLADEGHADYMNCLYMLGDSRLLRFERLGELVDVEDSVLNLRDVVQLAGDDHPNMLQYRCDFGISLLRRYERLNKFRDIEESMSHFQKVVQTEDGDPNKPMYLGNLGLVQLKCYEGLGELQYIEDSILSLQKAVQLTQAHDPNRPMYLANLGLSQLRRFERLGNIVDVDDSISNLQQAVLFTPDGHQNMPMYLENLGLSQRSRFERFSNVTDIENCVSNLQKAVQFISEGHPNMPGYLGNLGTNQLTYYKCSGELKHIQDSILNLQKAVCCTEDKHPRKSVFLGDLGISQLTRYECLGGLTDIKESVSNLRTAVQLADDGNPNKQVYLSNLGVAQLRRYECLGGLADIEESISNLRKAVQLTDDGDLNKPGYLSNLGLAQLRCYERLGRLTDIERSMLNLQKAVQLTDDGNPNKLRYLSNFGLVQLRRYECPGRPGGLADIDGSMSNLQKAVQFMDDGDLRKPVYLANLGLCQLRRYHHFGGLTDIEESMSLLQNAVQLTDDDNPNKPRYLANLSMSQLIHHEHFGGLVDAGESISNARKAVQLTEDGQLNKPSYLSNLGLIQLRRYQRCGKLDDIGAFIVNCRNAVQLTEDGHPDKPRRLWNFGYSHLVRYDSFGELADLQYAVFYFHNAVELTHKYHMFHVACLVGLGLAKQSRFTRLGEPIDLKASISAFKAAAQSKTGYASDALLAAQCWAEVSHFNHNVASSLDGYRTALEILPRVVSLGKSIDSRQRLLIEHKPEDLGCLSATCAIQLGHLEEAVALLDSGRSIFWQQASSLRSDLEMLRKAEPELAEEFERICQKLDARNFSADPIISVGERHRDLGADSVVGRERRRLAGEWEGLLERVRKLPQFELFMRPAPFSHLRRAATGGHVIIINVSQYGVDALIFDDIHQIEHVPLLKTNLERLSKLADDIVLHRPTNTSAAQRRRYTNRYLKPVLREIWNDILIPIFDKIQLPLNGNSDGPRRRIWWYPTGPLTFIPIHAAGPGSGEIDVSRLVISSYVTTLSSFVQAQEKHTYTSMGSLKLLALSHAPDTSKEESLPGALEEVDEVVHVVSSSGWRKEDIVQISGSNTTVDNVSRALDSCSWVHFACHGRQHEPSGINSAFALRDGDLKLSQIASKNLSFGRFAFLSACHTAAGTPWLPGEAMHLAGGLQFAGFPSVIATMWGIRDEDAPIVARHTYEYLFRNGVHTCDSSEAATALNRAVLLLRKDPSITVDRWAPFIHFGI